MHRGKSLRNGVHHANAVVWGPVYRTHLGFQRGDARAEARGDRVFGLERDARVLRHLERGDDAVIVGGGVRGGRGRRRARGIERRRRRTATTMMMRAVLYERMSGWSSKASVGVERRRRRGLKARGGRRDAPGKVLKDRRSPRQRGRMGTSV